MEFQQNRAIYLQITDHIGENILTGVWPEGERIPSVRELAVTVEVNPNTVMRAYTALQDRRIIYNRRGIGYFVADGAVETIRSLKRRRFIRRDLPDLFRTMAVLGISFQELEELFAEYRREKEKES